MKMFTSIFADLLHLFFPHVCTGCGSDLVNKEHLLCLECISQLPHTGFAPHAHNPIEHIFWGRVPLVAAHSEFFFTKASVIQHLIHQLKYNGKKEIGFYLGEVIGRNLLNSNRFQAVDYIIPLPMFADKEKKRGYNQATIICNGISASMNIPVLNGVVTRKYLTETQTRKSRSDRWDNVANSFKVKDVEKLRNKHILLIDDVVTTGASLEACARNILNIEGVHLSIATLAYASK